jgi:putative spermidine/putrescine transport system permease protein
MNPESGPRPTDVAFRWRVIDGLIALRRWLKLDRLESIRPYLMLAPALLLVTLLAGGIFYLVYLSFHSFDTFLLKQGPWSLEQYRRLVEPPSGDFNLQTLQRTLVISILVTVGSVALGLPVAYFIVRTRSRAMRIVTLVLLLVPFLMGEVVRAFGWSLVLGSNGMAAWVLSLFGNDSGGILGTPLAVWIGMMQVSIPLATLLILPALTRIDPDLERAAATMGAPPRRVWRHVVTPLARPGIAGAAAVAFLLSVAEYDMPAILGLGRLPFVANVIRSIYTLQNNLYLGSAFSLVLMGISTVFVVVLVAGSGIRRLQQSSESSDG